MKIPSEAVEAIAEILSRGKNAEVAERRGRVIVWEVTSKKKYESPVA